AIQTVDVTTSKYEAELGRATGAATNVIFKSGTNQFHGAAYEFNRVSALSSRAEFDPARAHFTYNYVGGNIGGPIIKNRTFFFGDYLKQLDYRYNNDRLTIPTVAERNGDFSAFPALIYDPSTGNLDGTGRTPFPSNQIPASRINPLSQKFLGLVPLPNLTGAGGAALLTNNFFQQVPFTRITDSFDIKVDHNQTANDRLSVRYSYSKPVTTDGSSFGLYGGPHGGGFQATGTQGTHNAAIIYDHIFGPTLITEVRGGLSRYRNDAQQFDYGKTDSADFGIPGVNINAFTSGFVGLDIGGLGNPLLGYSASLPWIRAETNINVANVWTKTLNNHTVKFGAEIRRIRDDLIQTQTYSPRGLYRFRESQTSIPGAKISNGNSFASFLLDVPSEAGRDLLIYSPAMRIWQTFAFVQDKWLVTPKLTVDLGLRWEFYPPANPQFKGGFSNYDPTTNNLVVAGVGGNPSNLGLDKHYKDFAPRIGIAYRLTEKTVFRGGFGISYSPFPDNTYAYNFPVKQNNAFKPDNSYGPAVDANGKALTFQAGFPAPTPAIVPANGIIPANTPLLISQVYEVINKHFREPYVESWNVAFQRSLPWNFSFEAAYVGNHGVAQPAVYNLNASTTIGADINGQPLYQAFGRKADTNLRYVGLGSSYNALQVKIDRRFAKGLAITTAYTWGRAEGYQSEDAGLAYYINPRRNWERLDFDRRQTFVQSYVWELPFGKNKSFLQNGVAAAVLGGWQVNGILTLMTGTPLNFTYDSAGLKAPGNSNSPNVTGPIKILNGTNSGAFWFDTSNFSAPAPLTFGNLGRNVISGPGFFNLDGSVFRTFAVRERLRLEFRAESFSATNTPQFNNPDTGITSATFGRITGAGGNRSTQLGVRILF
ncbi:MAG: TonB-dependent receptor, partial [Acidobacteriota bacterium]|nr:TonB-dependent receptor [Acidobacteriota bacterium]